MKFNKLAMEGVVVEVGVREGAEAKQLAVEWGEVFPVLMQLRKKERKPLQSVENETHRCPRGVYNPISEVLKKVLAGVQICYYPMAPTC